MSERALEIRAQNYFLLGPLWEISHILRDLFARRWRAIFLPRPLPPRADFLQVNGAAAALRAHSAQPHRSAHDHPSNNTHGLAPL